MLALGIRTGVIYRVSVDDGEVTPLYADEPGQFPDGIVVLDRQVFWTTMGKPTIDPSVPSEAGLDFSARNGGVHAVLLDGSVRRDVTGPITTGKQLAHDGAGRLYWESLPVSPKMGM